MTMALTANCIAKGSFHQGDQRFGISAGKQYLANSIITLAFASIVHSQQWI